MVNAALMTPPQRVIILQTATDQLARRLLNLSEAAPLVGYGRERLADLVTAGVFPIVRLPSESDDPARQSLRVPVAWLPRWIEMQDRSRPIFTRREEVGGRPGEPISVSVPTAAESIGLTGVTAYLLIRKGRFCPTYQGTKVQRTRVDVAALDAWVFGLVQAAEESWFDELQEDLDRGWVPGL